jgi:hypothetical protein
LPSTNPLDAYYPLDAHYFKFFEGLSLVPSTLEHSFHDLEGFMTFMAVLIFGSAFVAFHYLGAIGGASQFDTIYSR